MVLFASRRCRVYCILHSSRYLYATNVVVRVPVQRDADWCTLLIPWTVCRHGARLCGMEWEEEPGCMYSFGLGSSKKYPGVCSNVFFFRESVSPGVGVPCACVEQHSAQSVSGCVRDNVVVVACPGAIARGRVICSSLFFLRSDATSDHPNGHAARS